VLALAMGTAAFWYVHEPAATWLVLTSVLMVACPCALALATPFTLGAMVRVLGRNELYLKNAEVIERMGNIDTILFDKTGTVTTGNAEVTFVGNTLLLPGIRKLCSYSTHPLSVQICNAIHAPGISSISHFREHPGSGIEGVVNGKLLKVGSASFTGSACIEDGILKRIYVSQEGLSVGHFSIQTHPRDNIKELLSRLNGKCHAMLSGDDSSDRDRMRSLFPAHTTLLFNQSPHDKMAYILQLQKSGKKVMMIGDGLNDAGALKQADVGIALSDDKGIFSPACDGIISGERLKNFDRMIDFTRRSSRILKSAFAISFCYNAIALTFAVTGNLTPMVAAIIMPISSMSVVGFSSLAVGYTARKLKLQK
jgi:Cu+-exporting ATPase